MRSLFAAIRRATSMAVFFCFFQVALHRIDDGSMKFLTGRQKNVREVLALSVSPNKRVIAVCERGRALDEDSGNAQARRARLETSGGNANGEV